MQEQEGTRDELIRLRILRKHLLDNVDNEQQREDEFVGINKELFPHRSDDWRRMWKQMGEIDKIFDR